MKTLVIEWDVEEADHNVEAIHSLVEEVLNELGIYQKEVKNLGVYSLETDSFVMLDDNMEGGYFIHGSTSAIATITEELRSRFSDYETSVKIEYSNCMEKDIIDELTKFGAKN